MPGRPHVYNNQVTTDVPESAANTETVINTIAGISSEFPGQQVSFVAFATIAMAASTTAMTLRIRQDSLTGTLVGEAPVAAGDVVASKVTCLPMFATDTPGENANRTYVLTMQATAGATAANCTASQVTAIVS